MVQMGVWEIAFLIYIYILYIVSIEKQNFCFSLFCLLYIQDCCWRLHRWYWGACLLLHTTNRLVAVCYKSRERYILIPTWSWWFIGCCVAERIEQRRIDIRLKWSDAWKQGIKNRITMVMLLRDVVLAVFIKPTQAEIIKYELWILVVLF